MSVISISSDDENDWQDEEEEFLEKTHQLFIVQNLTKGPEHSEDKGIEILPDLKLFDQPIEVPQYKPTEGVDHNDEEDPLHDETKVGIVSEIPESPAWTIPETISDELVLPDEDLTIQNNQTEKVTHVDESNSKSLLDGSILNNKIRNINVNSRAQRDVKPIISEIPESPAWTFPETISDESVLPDEDLTIQNNQPESNSKSLLDGSLLNNKIRNINFNSQSQRDVKPRDESPIMDPPGSNPGHSSLEMSNALTLDKVSQLRDEFIKCYNVIFDDIGQQVCMKMGDLVLLAIHESRNFKSRLAAASKLTSKWRKVTELETTRTNYLANIKQYKHPFGELFGGMLVKIIYLNENLDQHKALLIALFIKIFLRISIKLPPDSLLEARANTIGLLPDENLRIPVVYNAFVCDETEFERNCWLILGFMRGINPVSDRKISEIDSQTEQVGSANSTEQSDLSQNLSESSPIQLQRSGGNVDLVSKDKSAKHSNVSVIAKSAIKESISNVGCDNFLIGCNSHQLIPPMTQRKVGEKQIPEAPIENLVRDLPQGNLVNQHEAYVHYVNKTYTNFPSIDSVKAALRSKMLKNSLLRDRCNANFDKSVNNEIEKASGNPNVFKEQRLSTTNDYHQSRYNLLSSEITNSNVEQTTTTTNSVSGKRSHPYLEQILSSKCLKISETQYPITEQNLPIHNFNNPSKGIQRQNDNPLVRNTESMHRSQNVANMSKQWREQNGVEQSLRHRHNNTDIYKNSPKEMGRCYTPYCTQPRTKLTSDPYSSCLHPGCSLANTIPRGLQPPPYNAQRYYRPPSTNQSLHQLPNVSNQANYNHIQQRTEQNRLRPHYTHLQFPSKVNATPDPTCNENSPSHKTIQDINTNAGVTINNYYNFTTYMPPMVTDEANSSQTDNNYQYTQDSPDLLKATVQDYSAKETLHYYPPQPRNQQLQNYQSQVLHKQT